MFLFSAIVLIDLFGIFVVGEFTSVINTTTGPVQGEILTTHTHLVPYAAFKGIRYGKAPVGYLRFKAPLPADPWTEILDATVEGNECPQIDFVTGNYTGSEDCLFLNVFTPVTNLNETARELKSVMISIYGGGFIGGSATPNIYGPDYLIERDVVLVTFNYRVGALGFLSLNHPNATGNAGLKDQNLAFKWVQANIEKFGGNPKNVTIFGESAGGVSVGFHVLSDASAGLFHGAISMSGTPLAPWGFVTLPVAVGRARRLCGLLGTASLNTETLLNSLYEATPEKLVTSAFLLHSILPFMPTLEDPKVSKDLFISTCSIDKYKRGNFTKIPQIIGFMEQETVSFTGLLELFFGVVNEAISAANHVRGALSVYILPIMKSLIGLLTNLVGGVPRDVLEFYVNVTTELLFKAPIDQTQRFIVAHNDDHPVYYYDITFYTNRSSLFNSEIDGAGHADDLPYMFYISTGNFSQNPSDEVARTIYRVSTMWTNFAKYGNPTPNWIDEYPLNITWPPSGKSGNALEIGNELKVVPRPLSTNAKIIELALRPSLSLVNGCAKLVWW